MTPLAHAILADSLLPLKARRYGDLANRLRLLDGLHFFDVTAVAEAAEAHQDKVVAALLAGNDARAFLPAPRTMLDWAVNDDLAARHGVILNQREDGHADVTFLILAKDGRIIANGGVIMVIPLHGAFDGVLNNVRRDVPGFGRDAANTLAGLIYAFLAMINTPRIIGRRLHNPHAGFQRKLAAAYRMPGKYPLQAWHELVLEVTPPRDESGQQPREMRLTGERALHFVRCHLRIRLGQLEMVTAHWRGNEELGIKQTRYRIVPPRKAA